MSAMLFEGTDLEDVLAEAQLCLGPDMQVESANRVRRGGLFGFFATEWFEVWARPPEVTADPVLALLEQQQEADEAEPFSELVRGAIADQRQTAMAGGPPTLSTAASTVHAAPPVVADPHEPELRYADTMDEFFGVDPWDEPETVARAHPDLAAITPNLQAGTRGATAPPADTTTDPEAAASTVVGTTPAAVALEDAPRGRSVFEPSATTSTGLLWAMLEKLEGLPAAPPVPTGPAVVAFVGEAHAALDAARRVGARTGLWNGDIEILTRHRALDDVPSWLVVNELEEAAQRAERWRQRGTPTAIVIDQSIDAGDRAWAMRALTAMRADQVRMVAEAWRLPAQVGELATRVGGIDVIDLVDVDGAVEPLAMLDLDIPVATVQGRPATADLLAAVWLENRRRG